MRRRDRADVPEAGEAIDVFLVVGVHEHRAAAAHPLTARSVNRAIVPQMNERGQVAKDEVVDAK